MNSVNALQWDLLDKHSTYVLSASVPAKKLSRRDISMRTLMKSKKIVFF